MKTFIRSLHRMSAFTLAELLAVMAIIAILAGLILSVSGYATKERGAFPGQGGDQGARSRLRIV